MFSPEQSGNFMMNSMRVRAGSAVGGLALVAVSPFGNGEAMAAETVAAETVAISGMSSDIGGTITKEQFRGNVFTTPAILPEGDKVCFQTNIKTKPNLRHRMQIVQSDGARQEVAWTSRKEYSADGDIDGVCPTKVDRGKRTYGRIILTSGLHKSDKILSGNYILTSGTN